MPKNLQISMMKKQFLKYNKDIETDLTAWIDVIDWEGLFDSLCTFPENRRNINRCLKDLYGLNDFTLYSKRIRETEKYLINNQQMMGKGWHIYKEQVVKMHKVKGYEYGSTVLSLPKNMVGHKVVLAFLDLTANEEKQFQNHKKKGTSYRLSTHISRSAKSSKQSQDSLRGKRF